MTIGRKVQTYLSIWDETWVLTQIIPHGTYFSPDTKLPLPVQPATFTHDLCRYIGDWAVLEQPETDDCYGVYTVVPMNTVNSAK